jgi:hypothetical protein
MEWSCMRALLPSGVGAAPTDISASLLKGNEIADEHAGDD